MTDDIAALLDADPYVRTHPQSTPFWQAAAAGRFLLPRCAACGRAHWYPRPFCPFCASTDVSWVDAAGTGRIHAFASLAKAATTILAYVELAEGPIMLTNLVDCAPDELAIGQPVQVRFRAAPEGRSVPVFAPTS